MSSLLTAMEKNLNLDITENGDLTRKTTHSNLLDLFAFGGSYRSRSEEDVIELFEKAFNENPEYALKCLFYLRDVRGGQGERRFFRLCLKHMAEMYPEAMKKLIPLIPEYGRWDDLYVLVDTPLEKKMFEVITKQVLNDILSDTPSLLGKWLKSENASSLETKRLAKKTRKAFGWSSRTYRKVLSSLREKINVLERLMSANSWDNIEFDKIPSMAGLKYSKTFLTREETAKRYRDFISDTCKKVNAEVLTPEGIVSKIFGRGMGSDERATYQKYWENLKDYFGGKEDNCLAVVDVSGSMAGTPMHAAIGLGIYLAERCNGLFKNHFITFSSVPSLIKIEDDLDIYDKVYEVAKSDWGMSTNIEATMELILKSAIAASIPQEEMPSTLYIFSDMEFNQAFRRTLSMPLDTFFEVMAKRYEEAGYEMPRVIFWNLDARHNHIPALGERFSYVSGFSPSMIEHILSGKDGYDLMMETLNSERYSLITI